MGKARGRECFLLCPQMLRFSFIFFYSENCQTSWASVIPWGNKESLKGRTFLEVWPRNFNYFVFNSVVTSCNPTLQGNLCGQGTVINHIHVNTIPSHWRCSFQMKKLKEESYAPKITHWTYFNFISQWASVGLFQFPFLNMLLDQRMSTC